MLLAATGKAGAESRPADDDLWIPGANGRYYEVHDVGNLLLMLPSAWVGSLTRKVSLAEWIQSPPPFIKFGVSLTFAVASALGCYFMFLLFALFYSQRFAFGLSLAFVTTTPFWAFSRSAWDVLGAAIGVCMLLYSSAGILLRERVEVWTVVLSMASLAIACSFRYSLMPFLAPALAIVLFLRRKEIRLGGFAMAAAAFTMLMLPAFIYNYVRTGSPLRPATVAAKYLAGGESGLNAMTGQPWNGLAGLLLSPNWGLLWYSPVFLLLAAFPFVVRRQHPVALRLAVIWGSATAFYVLLIGNFQNWNGTVGWGSRYLVPVMPILFFLLSSVLATIWNRHGKLVLTLLSLSFFLNLPPALVNWNLATLDYPPVAWPDQIRYRQASTPRVQMAVWNGMFLGLRGKLLPAPPSWSEDPVLTSIARFPDLWVARLMRGSQAQLLLGTAITLGLGSIAALALQRLMLNPTIGCAAYTGQCSR